ncbi:serine/threonine protein kinase [Amycolatopsis acidicola]|uniref:non-specific serine/threonine protein kinase n=1 Tax=Amycolatopsis acidicola TaxID=2596893 RepID=A0A5N0UX92_9PSEU|nr:serine/threonine-protein kinase [Amycolatopsis acidicola]KAA9157575.1 serine/threonine protein kinase [Amycolatopsis acidicola]
MTNEQTTQRANTPTPRIIAGRYALLAEIGRGGMGVVWRGEDRVIGRQVAIKELQLPDGAEDSVRAERVLREVRTGGRLNDPAVVTVFDVVSEDGGTFIVMELVEAPTLSELVRRNGPLPPAQAASIGQQVLTALQAAHEAGIVHRDVKPGNIMVAANGRVKLTDFGIAQAVDDPRLTTSGMIVGSPAFMAPERVAGKEALPASDLWSLGATLYFAVEGVLAFERPTTAATLHAIMNEIPYLTRIQGPLASAIMGLLVASPDGRISAAQAHQLLGMAATPAGQHTPPGGHTALWSGPLPTMQAPVQPANPGRRKLFVSLGAVAAVLLLAGGFALGDWWGTPKSTTDPAMLPTLTYGDGGDLASFSPTSSYSCYNGRLTPGYNISSDNGLDCAKAHDFEVYDTFTVFGGSTSGSDPDAAAYPGVDALARFAQARCTMTFHSNMVDGKARPTLNFRALIPTQQLWDTPVDTYETPYRSAYCAVTRQDSAQLTEGVAYSVK